MPWNANRMTKKLVDSLEPDPAHLGINQRPREGLVHLPFADDEQRPCWRSPVKDEVIEAAEVTGPAAQPVVMYASGSPRFAGSGALAASRLAA